MCEFNQNTDNDVKAPVPTEEQQAIIDAPEGFVIVDAGPGTGKTFTVVRRFAELVRNKGLGPHDIMMLTFSNKAADEMGDRLTALFASDDELKMFSDAVQARTFDSLCLSIVLDSASSVGELLGIEDTISHTASISTGDSSNKEYFRRFLDGYLAEHHEEHPFFAPIAAGNANNLFHVISKMMSFGIMPDIEGSGWRGYRAKESILGDPATMKSQLDNLNTPKGNRQVEILSKFKENLKKYSYHDPPCTTGVKKFDEDAIISAIVDDRSELSDFIHDVYLGYMRRCVRDNHLTYALVALLAFIVLYENEKAREANRRRFLIVDEFQDTNPLQMMITLMLLSEPNLCVVGDWKQGIYGFRFATIDNMRRFDERTIEFRRFLNGDGIDRVPFRIPEPTGLELRTSRRSSQMVIHTAYHALLAEGPGGTEPDRSFLLSKKELADPVLKGAVLSDKEEMEKRLLDYAVKQGREDLGPDDTEVRFVQTPEGREETEDVVKAVKDLVANGHVCEKTGKRRLGPADIAVLCPTNEQCRKVVHALRDAGVEAHLVGQERIMDTREGKLALAWLRYIANPEDRKGFIPIMADQGYPLMDLLETRKKDVSLPIQEQRERLSGMTDDIVGLLTSVFDLYSDLDPDVVQAIISVLSDAHNGSSTSLTSLISVIQQDIDRGTPYDIDVSGNGHAVNVMTMHKAKGLEFPAVIIPFMDEGVLPKRSKSHGVFVFDPVTGLRCGHEVIEKDGSRWIGRSWRTWLAIRALDNDHDEARRTLFVAVSRAKQYVTLICGQKPSSFIGHYVRECGRSFVEVPDCDYSPEGCTDMLAAPPTVPAPKGRPFTMPVHAIMRDPEEGIVRGGEGKEYGIAMHSLAQLMVLRRECDTSICLHGEEEAIRRVLESAKGAVCEAEVECLYPVEGTDATLSGTIDLLVDRRDWMEVHDWKTDPTGALRKEYELQLSVYARAVSAATGLPVRAFIHYISNSIGTVEVEEIWSDEMIAERVRENLGIISDEGRADRRRHGPWTGPSGEGIASTDHRFRSDTMERFIRRKHSRMIASGSDNRLRFEVMWDPDLEVVRFVCGQSPSSRIIELPCSDVEAVIDAMEDVFLRDWRSSGRPAGTEDSRRSRLAQVFWKEGCRVDRMAPVFEENVQSMGEDSCLVIMMKDGRSVTIPSSSILRSGPVDGEDSYGFLTTDGIRVFRGDEVDFVTVMAETKDG